MKQPKRKKTRDKSAMGPPAPLRVKFFAFKSNLLLDSRSLHCGLPSENAVNDWLANNPGIRIVEIKQSMCQMSSDNFATTLITVWYEGGPVPEPPEPPVAVAAAPVSETPPIKAPATETPPPAEPPPSA